jgi:hypothetical protein
MPEQPRAAKSEIDTETFKRPSKTARNLLIFAFAVFGAWLLLLFLIAFIL